MQIVVLYLASFWLSWCKLASVLRSHRRWPHVPILILTVFGKRQTVNSLQKSEQLKEERSSWVTDRSRAPWQQHTGTIGCTAAVRGERGLDRMRGRQCLWMKGMETADARLLLFLHLLNRSLLSSSVVQKNLDSISFFMTPGYLGDSTVLSVISSCSHTRRWKPQSQQGKWHPSPTEQHEETELWRPCSTLTVF